MTHHRSCLGLLGLLVVLALALPACRRTETAVDRANHDGVLLLGNGAEPSDIDPEIVTGTKEFNIVEALYEGLAGVDPEDLHPVPGAAESWDVSPDGLVYTFHLRTNGKWSNGDPVTAQDFAYSFQRVLSPELGSEFAFYLWPIRNAQAFNQKQTADFAQVGVKVVDDRTLEVTLENPTPYFLSLLRVAPFLPVHRATVEAAGGGRRRGTNWTRPEHFVGNGPFTLQEWTVNKVLTVRKSPTYWDAAHVKLNAVSFFPIDSLDVEERAFRAGQIHKTYGVPFSKIDGYRHAQPAVLRLDPYARTQYLGVNCRRPPYTDARLRRALGLAIDRDAIVRHLTRGGEEAAYSLVTPDLHGYTSRARMPYDPDAARALLAEAGHPGGQGLPPVEMIFNTSEANQILAEAIQQMWKKELGVDAVLSNQEWKVYLNRRTQQDYQVYEGGWTTTYMDPLGFLDLFVGGSPINQSGWTNAEYDGTLADAARTLDPAARFEKIQHAEEVLLREAPALPIYYWTRAYLLSPSVHGWSSNRFDDHPYKAVTLRN